MFSNTPWFIGDVSKWDVSSVTDMSSMFAGASSFNRDISKWDVSSVANMDNMFRHARSFKHKLCGAAWVHSKARKIDMFFHCPGSISQTVCTPGATLATTLATRQYVSQRQAWTTHSRVFSPQSKLALKNLVTECLTMSPTGDCSKGKHGPIGDWDVSSIT